jgi:acyl carrier protein
MASLVKRSVAAVLNFKNTDDIDVNRPFRELGFDSLTNAEFINHLDKTLKAGLSQSLYMEFPTVSKMSGHLVTMPAILDKLATVEVVAKPAAGASAGQTAGATAGGASGGAGVPAVPAAGSPKTPSSPSPVPAAPAGAGATSHASNGAGADHGAGKANGAGTAPGNGSAFASQGEGGLSYTSPVKDLTDGKAIEAQTDRYLQEHLSGGKSSNGARKGWWQRFMDALQDIES